MVPTVAMRSTTGCFYTADRPDSIGFTRGFARGLACYAAGWDPSSPSDRRGGLVPARREAYEGRPKNPQKFNNL